MRRGTKLEVSKFEIVFELMLCDKVQSDKNFNLFILFRTFLNSSTIVLCLFYFEHFQFKNEVKR
jgi:hypothetical protein